MLKLLTTLLATSMVASASPAALRPRDGCSITWNGTAITGTMDGAACRYTIRYGTAKRWEYPVAATNQSGQDAANFPSMCPQPVADELESALSTPAAQSEDCLFTTIYTPVGSNSTDLPVFVWHHGGDYVEGSESDKGLNGSALASESSMIVAVMQYRVGLLGFVPPSVAPTSADPNFGLRDAILHLEVIRDNVAAVGGNSSRVTVGGQSAGASLIRTMWGAPAAQGLFHGMIIQSDPMNFGTQSAADEAGLQTLAFTNATLTGNCTTFECFQNISITDMMTIETYVISKAFANVTGVPIGETFRPQYYTESLPHDPFNSLFNNASNLAINLTTVPIMITSIKNESGYLIEEFFSSATAGNEALYDYALQSLFGDERAAIVNASGLYPVINGTDGLRQALEIVVTDAAWRCVTRETARRLAGAGATVYLGEWLEGIRYTFGNGSYCTQDGVWCHGTDVYPTFSDGPAGSNTTFETLVRNYWTSFITTGSPASDAQPWTAFTANGTDADVHAIGDGPMATCPADFWGTKVQWDWMLYSSNETGTIGSATTSSATTATSKSAGTVNTVKVPFIGVAVAIAAVGCGALLV